MLNFSHFTLTQFLNLNFNFSFKIKTNIVFKTLKIYVHSGDQHIKIHMYFMYTIAHCNFNAYKIGLDHDIKFYCSNSSICVLFSF